MAPMHAPAGMGMQPSAQDLAMGSMIAKDWGKMSSLILIRAPPTW